MGRINEAQRLSHYQLHTLDGVRSVCGSCEVKWRMNACCRKKFQNTDWTHRFNRERYFIKLELATKQHSADLTNKISECASELCEYYWIIKDKTTLFRCIWSSEIIMAVYRLPFSG